MTAKRGPESIKDVLERVLDRAASGPGRSESEAEPQTGPADVQPGCYDFDLAEFPLFRLCKTTAKEGGEPLRYEDTITGRNGEKVNRQWAVYPGPFGWGGQSAQVLLFDLLQLYAEQGARSSQIQ